MKDARLERLSTADRTTVLADEHEAVVVANIGADRAALATLRSEAEAADSTLDTRAVRTELRDFRVVNYVLSTNILRQAEDIADEAAADPEAVAHLDEAVTAALAITAESTKSDVREAREHLRLAKNELDEDEVEDEVERRADHLTRRTAVARRPRSPGHCRVPGAGGSPQATTRPRSTTCDGSRRTVRSRSGSRG